MTTLAEVMLDFQELQGAIWSEERGDALAALNSLDASLRGLHSHIEALVSKLHALEHVTVPDSADLIDRLQTAVGLNSATQAAVGKLEDNDDLRSALLSVSVQLRTRLALAKHGRATLVGAAIAEARSSRPQQA